MAGAVVLREPCPYHHPHPPAAIMPGIIPATLPDRPHLYQPRFHQKTKLYQVVRDNLDEFLRVYDRRFAVTYGPLRPELERSFRAFLKCAPHGCGSVGESMDGRELNATRHRATRGRVVVFSVAIASRLCVLAPKGWVGT